MKQAFTLIAAFAAGCATSLLLAPVLFMFWFDWFPRAPVANWLASNVSARIGSLWGLVWVSGVDAVLVIAAGLLFGRFLRRRGVLTALLFCLGFVLAPRVLYWELHMAFGLKTVLYTLWGDLAVVACGIAAALAVSRFRRRAGGRGFEVASTDETPSADSEDRGTTADAGRVERKRRQPMTAGKAGNMADDEHHGARPPVR